MLPHPTSTGQNGRTFHSLLCSASFAKSAYLRFFLSYAFSTEFSGCCQFDKISFSLTRRLQYIRTCAHYFLWDKKSDGKDLPASLNLYLVKDLPPLHFSLSLTNCTTAFFPWLHSEFTRCLLLSIPAAHNVFYGQACVKQRTAPQHLSVNKCCTLPISLCSVATPSFFFSYNPSAHTVY